MKLKGTHMKKNSDTVIDWIIEIEGDYVNDLNDPGGETKYGISKQSYPKLDIKTLTKHMARVIYKTDYWNQIRGDDLPTGLDLLMMDTAVNCGVRIAVMMLQKTVRAKQDGIFGPKTMKKLQSMHLSETLAEFVARRGVHYASIDTFDHFGLGWMRRLANVHQMAIKDLMKERLRAEMDVISLSNLTKRREHTLSEHTNIFVETS